jgi:hypothetical protein
MKLCARTKQCLEWEKEQLLEAITRDSAWGRESEKEREREMTFGAVFRSIIVQRLISSLSACSLTCAPPK